MYQVSNALKAALFSQLLHIRICTEAGTELDHDTLTYTASCASGTDIAIGSVCAAMIRCKLYGAYDLQDAPITVEVGAEVDGAVQYVPLGRFYVTSQERAEDSTTITGYDAAYYALGVDYAPGFDYAPRVPSPVTVADVLEDITTQCGIDLATLPSGAAETIVDGDLTGHTCREMVGYMAALVGGNAVISREGKLRLIWYTDNGQSITPDDYYSGGLSLAGEITLAGVRMTKTVTVRTTGTDGTVTEVEQTTNYDAGSGTGTVIAVDNPFATQDIVDAVWAKIGGLGTFRAGSCSAFGGLLTEPGDLISVTGLSGLTSILPAMTVQLELDGGCRCTITASGQSQTEADAQILGPTGKALTKLAADIARFKELYADNLVAQAARITELFANFAEIETGDIGGFVFHDGYLESTGYYQNDDDFTVDTSLYLKAADAEDDGEPPKIAFHSRGSSVVGYETSAQLTVGGGSTRATGASAFDWVELSAMDGVQDLKSYIKLWAKDRLVEIGADTLELDGELRVDGHVTATGSLAAGLNVVIPNDGSVYIRDVNNVARRMLTITSANAATVGHSALPLSVYGSGITLAGATTISGNLSVNGVISTRSAVWADFGIVAGNNYGFYVKNASGSQVKLFWLTSGNVCTVGSNDYATSILGKTITASKTITVSSDRRLKRDITVLDGRHQALFDRLRPVSYRLREDEDGKEHIGLVAQEVQEALEQSGLTNSALVQADSEGMLSIGYGELIGLLIDEVQTLKARVKALEERGEI